MPGMAEMEAREETESRSRFSQRVTAAREKAAALAATRAAIFREELADKGAFAAKAVAGFAAAVFFGSLALILATALIAALFSKLFGSAILGVAATLVLYLAVAAAGAVFGWKALERVQPFDFPATGSELARDFDAVASAVAAPPEDISDDEEDSDDLEERFREGSE